MSKTKTTDWEANFTGPNSTAAHVERIRAAKRVRIRIMCAAHALADYESHQDFSDMREAREHVLAVANIANDLLGDLLDERDE